MSDEPRHRPSGRGLGRGLSALLGEEDAPPKNMRSLATELLRPGRFQPRRHFDDASLQALADSVRAQGILQPILVRRSSDNSNSYEILAGERRWRAAQAAQLHEVPVIIRELGDREASEIALVENIQRQDLNPIEEAQGYKRLIEEFGHTQEALATALGKSRSHIANTLRLLTLPEEVQTALKSWLEQRGTAPGPLFFRQDHARKGPSAAGNGNGRLTGQAVRLIIGRISQRAIGRRVKPHGLRHASITAALDLTNGNIRTVQSFSGHADPQTVMKYDDNRLDLAGDVAKKLSRLIS